MEVLYPRCCGIDVHDDFVVACFSRVEQGQRKKELQRFRAVTGDLIFPLASCFFCQEEYDMLCLLHELEERDEMREEGWDLLSYLAYPLTIGK